VLPANASVNDNLDFQYDFRNMYSTLLSNWLCVDDTGMENIMFKKYDALPIVNDSACHLGSATPTLAGNTLLSNYPNPFRNTTTLFFKSSGGRVTIRLADTSGQWLQTLVDTDYPAGDYSIVFDGSRLSNGIYYAHFQNMSAHQVRAMSRIR
ncbi:MAG TPA: T9SS type A sorting domain-containing protein, partial [Puia sp.]|nr:T9SS type A sorting domain-containing protein [Puia sp.]